MFGFGTLPVAANRIVIKQLGFCPGLLEEEGLLSVYESGGFGVCCYYCCQSVSAGGTGALWCPFCWNWELCTDVAYDAAERQHML